MKKGILLFTLLLFSFSFGQNKKSKTTNNKKTKTVVAKSNTIPLEKRINYIKAAPDDDIAIESYSSPKVVEEDENTVYNSAGVEVLPEFPGGREAINKYILSKYEFPDENEPQSAKVMVFFTIEKDGSITDPKIIKDSGFGSGKQILAILKTMPRWKPAELNGKKVRCSFMMPIAINGSN